MMTNNNNEGINVPSDSRDESAFVIPSIFALIRIALCETLIRLS